MGQDEPQVKQMSNGLQIADYQIDSSIVPVVVDADTVWISQKNIGVLLGIDTSVVNRHIGNLEKEGESQGIAQYAIPTAGGIQTVKHYNLDTVIEVGFAARKSAKAKAFRTWAKGILNRHVVRSIRVQEALDYSKVKDFIAQASDYDPSTLLCRDYFASVQNKLLYAVTGMTAAELVIDRVNAHAPNLGLQTWAGKNVTKTDAQTAKNYLTEDELKQVQALVMTIALGAGFLMQRQSSTMRQWIDYVDNQIVLFRCKLLVGKGTYSHDHAMQVVAREYKAFKERLANAQMLPDEIKE